MDAGRWISANADRGGTLITGGELNPTRASLLSRVRDPSDAVAWGEFDAAYRDLIIRYCRAKGLQVADAEDVRQLVMLSLSRALRTFEYQPARGRFRGYLYRTVRNAITQHIARPKNRPDPIDHIELAMHASDDEEAVDALWEREWMDHHYRLAMKTVRETFDPRSVDVFDRLLAGASVETVAGDFGMSTQAVHKVKQRIRDRMTELIRDQVLEEDGPD